MAKPYSYPFDMEGNVSGVRVIVTREPLCPGCLSDGEVDFQINALKEQLELLRPRMKAEARRFREAPLELRTTPLDASDVV